VLCLIGGMDRGLRVGGRCSSKLTLKQGTLLGVLKEGSTSAKVLWDDSDAIIRSVVVDSGAVIRSVVVEFCIDS